MSKKAGGATANGPPSRRLLLVSGAALATVVSLPAASADESLIPCLIEAHRQAVAAFLENANQEEAILARVDSRGAPEMEAWDKRNIALCEVMDDRFRALCAQPARTLAEARVKAEYLLNCQEPDYDEETMLVLLNSFLR